MRRRVKHQRIAQSTGMHPGVRPSIGGMTAFDTFYPSPAGLGTVCLPFVLRVTGFPAASFPFSLSSAYKGDRFPAAFWKGAGFGRQAVLSYPSTIKNRRSKKVKIGSAPFYSLLIVTPAPEETASVSLPRRLSGFPLMTVRSFLVHRFFDDRGNARLYSG